MSRFRIFRVAVSHSLIFPAFVFSCFPSLPIGLIVLDFIMFLLRSAYTRPSFELREALKNEHTYFALLVSFLFLPVVSMAQFAALSCVQLEDGSSYLRNDTSVDCQSADYRTFVALDGCLIALYQSVPLVWFVLLWRKKDRINHPERMSDIHIKYIKFLWKEYEPQAWYYEVIDMYRRITFIAIVPLIGGGESEAGAIVGCMISIFFIASLREIAPFKRKTSSNGLLVLSSYIIWFTFFVCIIIVSGAYKRIGVSLHFLGVALLLNAALAPLAVIYSWMVGLRAERAGLKDAKEREVSISMVVHQSMVNQLGIELAPWTQRRKSDHMIASAQPYKASNASPLRRGSGRASAPALGKSDISAVEMSEYNDI